MTALRPDEMALVDSRTPFARKVKIRLKRLVLGGIWNVFLVIAVLIIGAVSIAAYFGLPAALTLLAK